MTPTPQSNTGAAAPSILLGRIQRDEMPWAFCGRFRDRYPKTSHEGLANYLGVVPSYRKGFPTQLRSLVAALHYDGAPTLEELVLKHTFFPYALPEISALEADRLFSSMADETFPLSVPNTLQLHADFRVRVCACCIEEDISTEGRARYRCFHQIPRVHQCPIKGHGLGLFESRVTAATRGYIDPTAAIIRGSQLRTGNLPIAECILNAYVTLGRLGRDSCNRDQARSAFIELVDRRGHWAGSAVAPSLTRRIRGKYRQTAFKHFQLADPTRVDAWLSVPALAVACLALDVSFEQFVATAKGVKPDIAPPPPPTTAQLELFATVKEAVPGIISQLRVETARISIWAISKKIDQAMGWNFASNWSWRSPFRELLREQIRAAHG